MTGKMKENFFTLDPEAKIFKELEIQQPKWWLLLLKDKDLYINIRKDNYINVYYFGGSLAKIEYKNGFVAKTHQKYLGDDKPRGKTKKNTDKFEYDQINLEELNDKLLETIKECIKCEYLRHIYDENPAEKWIQGTMIKENPDYIDSEFQFDQDTKIGNLRIDLIELSSNGVLSFVELKGISDSRLRNDKNRNAKTPKIIKQMEKYRLFIKEYENPIKEYYEKLIEIRQNLGLSKSAPSEFTLNENPKLIIANTYKKMTKQREERISDIEGLLKTHKIKYKIEEIKCE